MKIPNLIVIVIGILLIVGSSNKTIVVVVRKVGSVLSGMAPGSSALRNVYNEQDKNRLARTVLIIFGSFLIVISLLVPVLK